MKRAGFRIFTTACMIGSVAMLCLSPTVRADEQQPVTFNRHVRPLLARACFSCHGPDAAARKAELRFDTPMAIDAKSGGHAILTPGDVQKSVMFQRITAEDSAERMPPPESAERLTADEIDVIRRWIEQGAEWEGHWSFITPVRRPLPVVINIDWPRNGVDRFVLARQEAAGIQPSPAADKRTLLRRVTQDLTGLPPTRDEIAEFLADENPDAYERVVDRLLDSPRFGERITLDWLDAARYADTHGYHEDYHREMWPWRDWVLQAFNANMPFDQFTVEQLAGDLLPDATDDQKIATGFNRNHGVTASGISEEYRVEYVLDRVRTTSSAWLGLTAGCAQCHDHKYDPLSQEEFYRMFAYFNTITDKGVENRQGNVDPLMVVKQPRLEIQLARLKEEIATLEARQLARAAEIGPELAAWEKEQTPQEAAIPVNTSKLLVHLTLDDQEGASAKNAVDDAVHGEIRGTAKWETGKLNGSLQFDGGTYIDLGDRCNFERTDSFSYGAWVYIEGNSAGAVMSRMNDALAYRGYDIYLTADHKPEVHILNGWPENAVHVKAKEALTPEEWHHVFVTYDGSSKAAGIKLFIDGRVQAVDVTADRLSETIRVETPLHIGQRNPSGTFKGRLDDVRIYERLLSDAEVAALASADVISPILAIAPEQRTEDQQKTITQFYLTNHDEAYRAVESKLGEMRTQADDVAKQASSITVMIMQEMETPRETFVLTRGAYDQHAQKVEPGTPAFLPALPDNAPPNRLGFARWLVSPEHPLTSRVTVNRFWQIAFGTGIVGGVGDFGTQGEWPSHPDLLDWLAVEFIESGWDVKALMRLLVTSATYRQSSVLRPELADIDPQNRLLARSPRHRRSAEMVRDHALMVSGLLVEHVGGPSVKPYQPAGLWLETSNRGYEQDSGTSLFRRSMYTYWKRSVPPPNMAALDAPNRETCVNLRQRTNTPLMALVLMNDPTFVEASRALAERILTEFGGENDERLQFAFELATARPAMPNEAMVLRKILDRKIDYYRANAKAADQLLGVGSSPRNASLDAAEHAAWTAVSTVILNLDETISKE
ncbi:MAG: DUF1553 domain-containing protein [Planctomycetota bacterium]|nr:DUF1553 domain-containing protein [Planctomycetota bacterium]MDA1213979.1 DUF1553 domain-containing protein [Planctomycetota bacterium]